MSGAQAVVPTNTRSGEMALTAEEAQNRANEIARDDLELKVWAAEARTRAANERRRKLERRQRMPEKYANAEAQREALLEIPCDEWLPALTQIEMPRGRTISCPLPGHDDVEPSCRFYETGFYCFSCNRGGRIFEFAGELWDI